MSTPNLHLQLSPSGLSLIETFESKRNKAYQDIKGIWTIGYGHTGPEVVSTLVWSDTQCNWALQEDVLWAAKAIQDNVSVVLNQNQFDALVSFTFNVGIGSFNNSTLLHLLNKGDYDGVALQFVHWMYAGTVISTGLLRRRKAEAALFTKAVV